MKKISLLLCLLFISVTSCGKADVTESTIDTATEVTTQETSTTEEQKTEEQETEEERSDVEKLGYDKTYVFNTPAGGNFVVPEKFEKVYEENNQGGEYYKLEDQETLDYFKEYDWYNPTIEAKEFNNGIFDNTEKDNLEKLQAKVDYSPKSELDETTGSGTKIEMIRGGYYFVPDGFENITKDRYALQYVQEWQNYDLDMHMEISWETVSNHADTMVANYSYEYVMGPGTYYIIYKNNSIRYVNEKLVNPGGSVSLSCTFTDYGVNENIDKIDKDSIPTASYWDHQQIPTFTGAIVDWPRDRNDYYKITVSQIQRHIKLECGFKRLVG